MSKKKVVVKKLVNHPEIKAYQKKMRKDNRCEQCIYPWYDGLCECGETDTDMSQSDVIAILAYQLMKNGWKDVS